MKRILLSIVALFTFFSSVAYSIDVHRLDYVNIEEVIIKAEQGDAEAQCTLGFCLLRGKYVDKDVRNALEWLRKSAEQECSDAQSLLGMTYYFGNDRIKQNKDVGKYWLRRAAKNGSQFAKLRLRVIEGIEKREEERERMLIFLNEL